MNEPKSSDSKAPTAGPERTTAVFANMVMQQTNMALMFLGQVPHPETGQRVTDLEAAQMFIDQLEMIEAKTNGNLDKREEGLLKQSLTALRMAFVEAVNQGPPKSEQKEPAHSPPAAGTAPAGGPPPSESKPPVESAESSSAGESHKKFSKKY